MKAIFELAFSAANIIPTVLFVFVALYWLAVIIGFADADSLDVDLDLDVDVDADLDVDSHAHGAPDVHVDMDGHAEADISWLSKFLIFFNVGKVPFMVWLSFVGLFTWTGTMSITSIFGITNFVLGLAILVPVLMASMFISKYMSLPFAKILTAMDDTKVDTNPVGKVCSISLAVNDGKVGQAEVNIDGNFQRIYVVAKPGVDLGLDATALVIQFNEEDNNYLVEPYQHT